ncbi:aspartate aminotransferase family protein [Nocardia terpenica]|uniref:Aminotransferase class III-fold pyridoxal phosphate-dependent enzyme n=1 Tax=Nocardia terpenica TaxID=455432 RepID=A0A6G9YZ29_9NOCA|nr:aminotransferase class III-fold pyridoxal phosphate-dependent enzyme [Nocardia terpenica]QIS18430.1 aminotransferase class III-fold pyridoxal phosphate-dependent enzyme [Nocardia terpenica]
MTTTDTVDPAWVADRYRRSLSAGRARLAAMLGGQVEVHSEGAWLTTSDGERYLNAGGYAVLFTGARHPLVVEEVQRQLHTHPVGTRLFLEPTAARAAEALLGVAPAGLERVYFGCTGAEAVETAIKLARVNGRRRLIATTGGFHGKTLGALSITGRPAFQDPFRPLLPGVVTVPYGDTGALAAELERYPGEACVVLEPVQGENGVVIPPPGYLTAVRALCSEYGALLVVDEIQTGLGRLGAWWGCDRERVRPDILLSGKCLGGGVIPVSAVLAPPEVFAPLDRDPFLHTSTFSAVPIAMAAVCGAIRAITEDDLVARAAALGTRLRDGLTEIAARRLAAHGCRVRGEGLLIGVELADPGLTGALLVELVARHVVANLSLNCDRVLRLTPPAVLTDAEADLLLETFDEAASSPVFRH